MKIWWLGLPSPSRSYKRLHYRWMAAAAASSQDYILQSSTKLLVSLWGRLCIGKRFLMAGVRHAGTSSLAKFISSLLKAPHMVSLRPSTRHFSFITGEHTKRIRKLRALWKKKHKNCQLRAFIFRLMFSCLCSCLQLFFGLVLGSHTLKKVRPVLPFLWVSFTSRLAFCSRVNYCPCHLISSLQDSLYASFEGNVWVSWQSLSSKPSRGEARV